MARVIVIGAGMGGLCAAARLSGLGHQVSVVEQADTVGGKLGILRRDGFAFDTGPSLLTLPGIYRETYAALGRDIDTVLRLRRVDPVCHYRFADGSELDMPDANPAAVRGALDAALGPGAGAQWQSLLEHAQAIWQVTRGPFLESELRGPATLVGLARDVRGLLTVAPWRSLRGLGERHLRDPRLRTLLDRYATYTGSDPRRAPAALAVVPYVEQTFGAWYVEGGLRQLADTLGQALLERGVTLHTGTAVAEVLASGGRATGVRLADGGELPADVVVSDADAEHLYADLVPPRHSRAAMRRMRRAQRSLSGFVMLLALRGRTPGLAHHTVLFPADYDAEFDAVFGTNDRPATPVADPTVYLSVPDDPALRPDPDSEAWFVLVNAPRHGDPAADPGVMDWTATGLAEDYADRVLEVMAERGLDVRDRLLWRELRTPADLERDTRSPGGAIYGTSSNGAGAAFLRAANRSPLPGLYLVGGSAHPGGGLPLVALSARIVARLIGPA